MGFLWAWSTSDFARRRERPGRMRQGPLKVGRLERRDDAKTSLVARWRDIDDASFTLHSEGLASGRRRLAVEQFND